MPTTRPSWLVQRVDVPTLLALSNATALHELLLLVGEPASGRHRSGRSWRAVSWTAVSWPTLCRSIAAQAAAAGAVAAVIGMYVLTLMQLSR